MFEDWLGLDLLGGQATFFAAGGFLQRCSDHIANAIITTIYLNCQAS